MKPKLMTEKRWGCSIATHRHRTREVAEICIARSERPKKKYHVLTDDLYVAIRAKRDAGMTLAAIGGEFDLTKERVRQLLAKWERIQRELENSRDR